MAEDERKSSGSFGSEVGKLGKKYRDYNPAKGLTDRLVSSQRDGRSAAREEQTGGSGGSLEPPAGPVS
jgi:hypothetical protein